MAEENSNERIKHSAFIDEVTHGMGIKIVKSDNWKNKMTEKENNSPQYICKGKSSLKGVCLTEDGSINPKNQTNTKDTYELKTFKGAKKIK